MNNTAWVVVMVFLFVAFSVAWLYNRLVAARNLARQGFADVDVQLKRRADLTPALVEAVRGYAAYEQALLKSVTEARAYALQQAATQPDAARFSAEGALAAGLQHMVLLQENYPALRADQNFRDLTARLVEIEDHLQYARRFYNGAVKQYCTRLESFPDIVVARLFGFTPFPFFETDDRSAVAVQL